MYIKVRVKTDQKAENIQRIRENEYTMSVKQPARMNLANKRIIEILKERLLKNNIRIVSGHRHGSKIVSVED